MPWRLLRDTLGGRRVLEDHRRAFLADHDRGRVGVAAWNLRHDRGVGDAQSLDPVDAQPRIDHRIDLAAHPAGADRVQIGDPAHPDLLDHLLVALTLRAGDYLLADKRLQRRLRGDLAAQPRAIDERLKVVVA